MVDAIATIMEVLFFTVIVLAIVCTVITAQWWLMCKVFGTPFDLFDDLRGE